MSTINIGCGERVTPLDPSLQMCIDIYKQPFISGIKVLVELVKAHFECEEWAVSFQKEAPKKQILIELSSNGI